MSRTVHDIKYIVENNDKRESFFFSKNTMKFWGQKMSDFKVITSKSDRVFIYAPNRLDGKFMSFTCWEFIESEKTLTPCNIPDKQAMTAKELVKYIKNNF